MPREYSNQPEEVISGWRKNNLIKATAIDQSYKYI
jgi:hypothetical protein